MKKEEKPTDGQENQEQNPIDSSIQKQSTIDEIFDLTESRNKKQDINKEAVVVRLIGGLEINVCVLAKGIQKHQAQFHLEFYEHVFRILNLPGDPALYLKDKAVAEFTIEVVYGRFNKEDIKTIKSKNKFVGKFVREHKFYEFFNEDGIRMLQLYIEETIKCLKTSTTNYEFRKKMFDLHKLPYQIELFS